MNTNNISVAKVNGYTLENVKKAKQYLDEIGSNRRHFPLERLVEMYNEVKGTNERAVGCRPCQSSKFYNGIMNYYTYGKLTLINNGVAKEEDFENVKPEPVVEEPTPEPTIEELSGETETLVEAVKEIEEEPKRKKAKK